MANTLNLGNGDWATKENSLLGYNSESGNYKPLAFDFTRASNGTFVNKSGLIETAANGVPRIDFLGNTNGALLLEPQRTNLVTQSNQFDTTWNLENLAVTSNQVGVGGSVDAWKLTPSVTSTYHRLTNSVTGAANLAVTLSVYAKSDGYNFLRISENGSSGDYATFNLLNGSVANNTSLEAKIEIVGNGWYRCSSSIIATPSHRFDMYVMESATIQQPWSGDGTSGVLIYGAQLEVGSYATSLINTQGSAVTRVADACSQTPPSGIIGQTEGTIYAEMNVPSIESVGGFSGFRIFDGTSANQISFIIYPTGRLQSIAFDGGTLVSNINDSGYGLTSGVHKIAIAYKLNDYVLYVDGSIVGSDTSATVPSVNQFIVSYTDGGSQIYNESKIYNTRLSNSELAALTTI